MGSRDTKERADLTEGATPPSAEVAGLARTLCHAHRQGHSLELLKGRRIAVLTDDPFDPASLTIMDALRRLGADVVDIAAGLTSESPESDIRATAHVLGKLYDAVDCESATPSLAQALRSCSDIPVFFRLARDQRHDGIAMAGTTLEPGPSIDEWSRAVTLAHVVTKLRAFSH